MIIADNLIRICSRRPSGQKLLVWFIGIYDRHFCSSKAVLAQAFARRVSKASFTFSVGIAHYNRGASISIPLRNLLNHPSVGEVVIVDDGSDEKEWALLKNEIHKYNSEGKIKLFRRENNLGALETKLECVQRSSLEWVLVLDSDNTAFSSYLETLGRLKTPPKNTIYCAGWAFPFFSFRELQGMTIDFESAGDMVRSGILGRIYIMNDGNYLVPKAEYSRLISDVAGAKSHAADVLMVNYRWLSAGNYIKVLKGTKYLHRIDSTSFWSRTAERSKSRLLEIYDRLQKGLRWDESFLNDLRS